MGESLWAITAEELLTRTASAAPTPGGGSIAGVTGALGVGLMRMALAVTGDPALAEADESLLALQARAVAATDADVAGFERLMAAYRLPHEDAEDATTRRAQIEEASAAATEEPLRLAEALVEAIELSQELQARVKPGIVSDVVAGRDLATGAAWAAIRTADINLAQLERMSSPLEAALRARRDGAAERLEARR